MWGCKKIRLYESSLGIHFLILAKNEMVRILWKEKILISSAVSPFRYDGPIQDPQNIFMDLDYNED